jgi:hypothetical protein
MPKASRKPLYDKIEAYDVERADLEIDLSKLKIAHEIRYTEEDIIAWLKAFVAAISSIWISAERLSTFS